MLATHSLPRFLSLWVPVLVWCGVIFFFSSQEQLPGPPDPFLDFCVKKTAHMIVFGTLYLLLYRAFSGANQRRRIILSCLATLAYAISDELHQSFVPGRTPTIRDIGIDMLGVGIAHLLFVHFVGMRGSIDGGRR